MHQPIYWNDQSRLAQEDRYEYAWETIQMITQNGAAHPSEPIQDYFGKADRVAAYQYRMRDSLGLIGGGHPDSGAAVSYSGSLMENVNSLGQNFFQGQDGQYTPDWWVPLNQATEWTTTGGNPRMDMMNFSFHHALAGLHNPETVYMEIRLHQEKVKQVFGEEALSKGFFPSEMSFSTRLIPVLADLGIEWSIVSGEKISRAMPNFPLQLGTGGVNTDPPNPADQINPPSADFIRTSISRGCSPVNANPESFQPAYAKYVDPVTGEEDRVIVVPADQAWSWNDGYGCINADFMTRIANFNDPAQPSLVLLSHDGDNAFGGGFTYYNNCVPDLANNAGAAGYQVSTIQEYLDDFPPDSNNVIHVEDGAWVNADSDFGSPTYINWNYPLLDAQGNIDPVNGWHEKPRDMAIFTAALNRVLTAEQIAGHSPDFAQILNPGPSTHPVDRAWHYYLGSLDSGNVYYGAVQDLEVKATIGCNEAIEHADPVIASNPAADSTPPSIWLPQRHPYNPGGLNFGVQYGYQQFIDDGDFHIWTFIHDVSGPVDAVLKYRIDADGTNPLSSNQNETFAGGEEVGDWVELPMNRRVFPKGDPYNKPELDFFELPEHISDHFSVEVTGLREVLIDYYVEATDSRGNVSTSPIQHVWIGDGQGSTDPGGSGGGPRVTLEPETPQRGQSVIVTYEEGGSLIGASQVFLRVGYDGFSSVVSPDLAMTRNPDDTWEVTFTTDECATELDLVFNDGQGNWDNNGGADWHYALEGPFGNDCQTITDAVTTVPAPPVRGETVTLTYDARGRVLEGAPQVYIHYGINGFRNVINPDPAMTEVQDDVWEYTFTVDPAAEVIDVVFNNGAGTWDNNGGEGVDWHIITQQGGAGTGWWLIR